MKIVHKIRFIQSPKTCAPDKEGKGGCKYWGIEAKECFARQCPYPKGRQ